MEDIIDDLFNKVETLPQEVQDILEKHSKEWGEDYGACRALVTDLEAVGYTCEYYLDAAPFNLQKIKKI